MIPSQYREALLACDRRIGRGPARANLFSPKKLTTTALLFLSFSAYAYPIAFAIVVNQLFYFFGVASASNQPILLKAAAIFGEIQ